MGWDVLQLGGCTGNDAARPGRMHLNAHVHPAPSPLCQVLAVQAPLIQHGQRNLGNGQIQIHCSATTQRSSELTSIITSDARSTGSGGGAYERKLKQDSLLSGHRGVPPSPTFALAVQNYVSHDPCGQCRA